MKNTLVLSIYIFSFLFQSCQVKLDPSYQNPSGKIIEIDSFPSVHVDPRPVSIWLPSDYDSNKRYAVLYMHDGQMLYDSTYNWTHQEWKVDETMSRLTHEKKIRETIVVGIHNNGSYRWAEYVPQAILDRLPEDVKNIVIKKWLNERPSADLYLAFITRELKPYIDQHYSTLPDQANTFIMGSSMGGIISLYALCEYPDVFGGAGCLSTHWPLGLPGVTDTDITYDVPGEFLTYLAKKIPPPANHRFYFDHGTVTLDSLYAPYQLLVDSIMKQNGYTGDNWVTKVFPGENHTEQAWARRLHIPLEFLLGKK